MNSVGEFEPTRGVDDDYDSACDNVSTIKEELETYKETMCHQVLKQGASAKWKYINTKNESRDKYLIELPVVVKVPGEFYVTGKR